MKFYGEKKKFYCPLFGVFNNGRGNENEMKNREF